METDRSPLVVASATLTSLPDAAFATDLTSGDIIAWNPAATELTGIARATAMAGTCGTLLDGIDDVGGRVCSVDCAYRRVTARRQPGSGEPGPQEPLPGTCSTWERHPDMLIRTPHGRRRVVVVSLPALIDGRRAMLHILRADSRSDADALTGALTREAFTVRIAEEQRRARRASDAMALAVVDLDLLKDLNDAHGQATGDRALAIVADALSRGRSGDVVARWGGDEFCVLLTSAELEEAARRLERALDVVRSARLVRDRRVSFSAGVTRFDPGELLAAAFDRADAALYRAKAAGRGCVVVAESG